MQSYLPVPIEETARWYEGKTFSTDWTSWHFPTWMKLLAPFRNKPARMLEIGSWEGRSALFFLNYLPQMQLTCVDTFAGGQEHQEAAAVNAQEAATLRSIEAHFDFNTGAFFGRLEKIKAPSVDALIELGVAGRRFDIAYIDGGHRAREVYADSALTWPLMAQGGLVIFDDYQWAAMPDRMDNPKPGVDAFLNSVEGQYRTVHYDYQVAIEKL
ncbi:class I SAM-dependent methyltransferase [Pseudorhodoplanes sp.]|uniref:class I SAM-dependent methyltransferase n=1 Tax=Pseudorhodoplanes sp. TaxID=1934341 RepID=UPI003D0E7A21